VECPRFRGHLACPPNRGLSINDNQGHAAGDALLRDVPTAITSTLRSYDVTVRWGGDEFVCALSDVTLEPATVPGLESGVKAITTGRVHTCALTSEGAVECWGGNDRGQLGDGTKKVRSSPENVLGLKNVEVVSIAAGDQHTCAITSTGELMCWGFGACGQLGTLSEAAPLIPIPQHCSTA